MEHLATEERGESLTIFDLNHEKAPTLAQITLQLTNIGDNSQDTVTIVDWISDGIKVQNDQFVLSYIFVRPSLKISRSRLRSEIKKLPQKPTVKQQLKISRMRTRLRRQVNDFLQRANSFLPNIEESDLKQLEDEEIDTPEADFVEPEDIVDGSLDEEFNFEDEEEAEVDSVLPELFILPLPSNIISVKLEQSLETHRSIERELRKGQANDSLEGLRIGLANKSLLLLTKVNQSTSTKQSTRAWASVRNTQSQILIHARTYQRAWQALKQVGTEEDLDVYQRLDQKDLVVVKDITAAKRFGQGSHSLAWFWRIGPNEDSLTGEWMEECKCNQLFLEICVYMDFISLSSKLASSKGPCRSVA